MNHPTAEDMIRTMAFVPQSGSVVDPLVDEISWVAWRLDGYDPHGLTHESMLRVSLNFDCLVELAWMPGRVILISQVTWDPESESFSAHLAIGVLGEAGSTAAEARSLDGHIASVVNTPPFAASRVDPTEVVPGSASRSVTGTEPVTEHAAIIRQRNWSCGDEEDVVEVLSRFAPTVNTWTGVARSCGQHHKPVRVRATVMATELSAHDRLQLADALRRVTRPTRVIG